MANATNQQIQAFADERMRQWAESCRSLYIKAQDHISNIDDVYASLVADNPTWADTNAGNPPHLLTANDMLAWNAFIHDFVTFMQGNAGTPVVLKACVRPV